MRNISSLSQRVDRFAGLAGARGFPVVKFIDWFAPSGPRADATSSLDLERAHGGKAEPKGIGFDSMPLFVVVVRYGALSRYRCVLRGRRTRIVTRNETVCRWVCCSDTLRSTFGPDVVNATIDSILMLSRSPRFWNECRSRRLYRMPAHAFLEVVNRLAANTSGYIPVKLRASYG